MKKFQIAVTALGVCLLFVPSITTAQSVDAYSTAKLAQFEQGLRAKADKSGGLASVKLEKYPNHLTIIAFRNKDGQGELHKQFADVLFVIDGGATLVTGGSLVNPKPKAPGEIVGESVRGGVSVKLNKGDIAHIAANTPHQLLVPAGGSFTYFIVKVHQ